MAFQVTRPLRFGDCDPSGIAYFPSYLNMLVGVVEDFFESLGWPWHEMVRDHRMGTPTLKLDILFTAPGFEGDRLDFTLRVEKVGRSSLTLHHEIRRADTLLWSARQVLVATSLDSHSSTPWPERLRAGLMTHLEAQNA